MAHYLEALQPSISQCVAFVAAHVFAILWIYRYLRLLVHCVSHWLYKSKRIPEDPLLTSKDVTVIIPTIHHAFEELRPSLLSILACHPRELILVTTAPKVEALRKVAGSLGYANVKVLHTNIANKRIQVCEALPQVTTQITVMADDDVTWPNTLLPGLLAPFEDPKIGARVGGVGTCQRVKRVSEGPLSSRIFNWLGAAYIERRNFEISATHNIDGGTSCMSGRTGAYRSEILKSHDFLESFKTETWGKWTLNCDDDNFVTRWLVSHKWKTWIQYEPECEIETTLEDSVKFLYQCSRWARSNWRSNFTSLVREKHVLTQQPWCTYALHLATFSSLAFITDPLLIVLCWRATDGWQTEHRYYGLVAQLIFMFVFTKVVKLVGLFRRNPSDIVFLPISILFGYLHGFIKVYALFTLNVTSWGSREDGDINDKDRLTVRPSRSQSLNTPPWPDKDVLRNIRERAKAINHEKLSRQMFGEVESEKIPSLHCLTYPPALEASG